MQLAPPGSPLSPPLLCHNLLYKASILHSLQKQQVYRVALSRIMSLLLLQMLVLSCLGATELQRNSQQRKSRGPFQHFLYLNKNLFESQSSPEWISENPVGGEETLKVPSFFVSIPQTASGSEKKEEKKMSRFILPSAGLHADQNSRTWAASRETSPVENLPPSHYSSKRESEVPYRKDAKKFWDHFMLKKNSASEEVVLPIKTNEMHQENCRTLPFAQVRTSIQDQQTCLSPISCNQQLKGHGLFKWLSQRPSEHLTKSAWKTLMKKFSLMRQTAELQHWKATDSIFIEYL